MAIEPANFDLVVLMSHVRPLVRTYRSLLSAMSCMAAQWSVIERLTGERDQTVVGSIPVWGLRLSLSSKQSTLIHQAASHFTYIC